MPSRLFWLLRHYGRTRPESGRPVSMPSRLFWLLRQVHLSDGLRGHNMFQCLLGFSGFCDPTVPRSNHDATGFNAFSAFLASATEIGERAVLQVPVSMPSRLFWLLRPARWLVRRFPVTLFQCLLGFSGFCDPFLTSQARDGHQVFQCLLGFSGFCDGFEAQPLRNLHAVSMPSRLFWLLRRGGRARRGRERRGFNAFSAFLASATDLRDLVGVVHRSFQCLLGFSGFCDRRLPGAQCRVARDVSMPSRLFWLLRRPEVSETRLLGQFQCLLGFSGFCDPRPSGR